MIILPTRRGIISAVQFPSWNAADKDPTITLSNGNKTATADGTAANRAAVRSITAYGTGKWGFSSKIDTASLPAAVGWVRTSLGLTTLWSNFADAVVITSSGAVRNSSVTIGTMPSLSVGDVVDFLIDFDNQLVWVRINGGLWNNSGTADPSAGTGGFSCTGIVNTNSYLPGVQWNASTAGQSSLKAFSPPTNFKSAT